MAKGICECGCEQKTLLARMNDKSKGWIKGEPLRFLNGHALRVKRSGKDNPRWKGGRYLSSHGYVVVREENGSRSYEHILVAEQALGRSLKNYGAGNAMTEVVHHINGDKQDNRPENLLICTHRYHTELHHKLAASPEWPEFPEIKRPGFGADRYVHHSR